MKKKLIFVLFLLLVGCEGSNIVGFDSGPRRSEGRRKDVMKTVEADTTAQK